MGLFNFGKMEPTSFGSELPLDTIEQAKLEEATSIPIKGIIGVDMDGESTVITHMLTHEQYRLDGMWVLEADEEETVGVMKRADVEQPDQDDVCDFDDPSVFSKRVVTKPGSDKMIVVEKVDGKKKGL